MICPKCGKETKSKKFCTQCGENIESLVEEAKKAEKAKKNEKMMKVKCRIAICLFIIFILLLGAVIGLNVHYTKKNFKEYNKKEEAGEVEGKVNSNEILDDDGLEEKQFELTEENKTEDYDDDGLTNEEEVNLGTDPIKADSDDDGLEDGDEVNRYKTDPLKWSTSGDSISDFVKIDKDLEVDKVYAEDEIKPEPIEENSYITLEPEDLESESKGVFREFSTDNKIKSEKRVFSVYDFKGKIIYTLDDTDVVLLTRFGNNYTEFGDYEIKSKKMTINITEKDNGKDFVIVTKEKYKEYQKGGADNEETH